MSSRTPAEKDAAREAFEEWMQDAGRADDVIERDGDDYADAAIRDAWLIWRGSRETAQASAPVPVSDGPMVRLGDVIAWLRERESAIDRGYPGGDARAWALNRAAWTLENEPPAWAQPLPDGVADAMRHPGAEV